MAASTLSFDAYRSVEVHLADQAATDAAHDRVATPSGTR